MRLSWGIVLLGVAACGGGEGSGGPADAGGSLDAVCPVPTGRAYVNTMMAVLPATEGYDLDSDGDIDNALGLLPENALASVNAGLTSEITNGRFLTGALLSDWAGPAAADDPDVGFEVFPVYDADVPADASNNLGGEGTFLIADVAFDLSCGPAARAESASIAGGVLTARRSLWNWELSAGTGQLTFQDVLLVVTFDAAYGQASGMVGAKMPFCALASLPAPGDLSGSVLDVIVNDPSLASSTSPDIDDDGDGIEQVIGDGVGILRCLDGDGTPIEGADCVCHPAIADGYSVALGISLIRADFVGVR